MKLAPVAVLLAGVVLVGIGCGKAEEAKAQTKGPAADAVLRAPINYAAIDGLFKAQCDNCHGGRSAKGGLSLVSYDGLLKGGDDGPGVVPGDPDKSVVLQYLNGSKKPKMPYKQPRLADSDIQAISDWIKSGAKKD